MILKSYMNFSQNLKLNRCTEIIHHVVLLVLVCALIPVLVHALDVQDVLINVKAVERVLLHVLVRVHLVVDALDNVLDVVRNVPVVLEHVLMVAPMLVKADVA